MMMTDDDDDDDDNDDDGESVRILVYWDFQNSTWQRAFLDFHVT